MKNYYYCSECDNTVEFGHDNGCSTKKPLFIFGSESHGIPELITNQKVDSEYDMG